MKRLSPVGVVVLLAIGCMHRGPARAPRSAATAGAAAQESDQEGYRDIVAVQQRMPSEMVSELDEPAPTAASPEGAAPAAMPRPPGTMLAGEAAHLVPPGDKLIVTGTVRMVVNDAGRAAVTIRERVIEIGGSVVGETVTRGANDATGEVRVRLPPEMVTPFLEWLETRGKVENRRVQAEDVSRKFFDQDVAIKNLQITIGRLQQLASRPQGELKEILEVERELTRVRGQLEEIEGEHRFLRDRIARATLDIQLSTRQGAFVPPLEEPELKFQLVPRGILMAFVDDRDRAQVRPGAGLSLMFTRSFALELEVFPSRRGDARSMLLGIAGGGYSDFLGRGRRRVLNPYLGLRMGVGSFNDRGLVSGGADVGLELFRHRLFFAELAGRVFGFYYFHASPNRTDIAVEGTAAVGVPF